MSLPLEIASPPSPQGNLSRIPRRGGIPPWGIFLLLSLGLGLEFVGLGPFSYVRVHDTGDSGLPRLLMLARDWKDSGMSSWLSFMGCGVDRVANDLLYPHILTMFFFVLPGWAAYQLFVFLHYFLGGYFTYRVARDLLHREEVPSIYAGAVYAFFSNDLMSFQLGFTCFPLFLWSLERIGRAPSRARFLWGGLLAIAYSSCSSLPWTLPFTLALAAAWFGWVRRVEARNFAFLFIFVCAVVLFSQVLSAWALVVNSPLSHRADWRMGAESLSLKAAAELLTQAVSFLLVDKTSLILASAALILLRGRSRTFLALLAMLLASTLGVALLNGLKVLFHEQIGFLKGYQFDRFYELAPFWGALCGGWGLQEVFQRLRRKLQERSGPTTGSVSRGLAPMLMLLAFLPLLLGMVQAKKEHFLRWLRQGSYTANYQSPALRRLANGNGSQETAPFRVATIADGILHPAYAQAYGLETADGYINLYPETYQRFWAKVIEPLTRKDEHLDRYFNGWGSRVYLFKPKRAGGEIVFQDYYRLNLLSLANTRYLISRVPLTDENLILIRRPAFPAEPATREDRLWRWVRENFRGRDSLYLYENTSCLPRFYLTRRVEIFSDVARLLEKMSSAPPEALRETAYLDAPTAARVVGDGRGCGDWRISVTRYSPDRIELSLETDGPAVLVASNTYSPFWKCRVDGSPRNLFLANGTFWGLRVGREDKRILFYYDPPYRISSARFQPA
jgi:hypothetical protein